MPLKMTMGSMQAIYGSFNFQFRTDAELAERSPSAGSGAIGSAFPVLPLSVAKAN